MLEVSTVWTSMVSVWPSERMAVLRYIALSHVLRGNETENVSMCVRMLDPLLHDTRQLPRSPRGYLFQGVPGRFESTAGSCG